MPRITRSAVRASEKVVNNQPQQDGLQEAKKTNEEIDEGTTSDMTFPPPYLTDSSQGSSHSEYGSKRKRPALRKKTTRRPRRAPKLPRMSESESEGEELREPLWAKSPASPNNERGAAGPTTKRTARTVDATNATLPDIVQIRVNTGGGKTPTTINLNLADFVFRERGRAHVNTGSRGLRDVEKDISQASEISEADDPTLVEETDDEPESKRAKLPKPNAFDRMKYPHKTGFVDLPYELRVRVYRQLFVTELPVNSASRTGFPRSSGFLSTCRTVYEEGREILYGENSFHFERSIRERGKYYEEQWTEVGFKDVRRFLHAIGPINVSMMNYVSIILTDAPVAYTPYLSDEERRCVNDPVLHSIFHTIGEQTILSIFAINLRLRRQIDNSDYHFLKALSSIRCHELIHSGSMGHFKAKPFQSMADKLKQIMLVEHHNSKGIDLPKKKGKRMVKMHQEWYRDQWRFQ